MKKNKGDVFSHMGIQISINSCSLPWSLGDSGMDQWAEGMIARPETKTTQGAEIGNWRVGATGHWERNVYFLTNAQKKLLAIWTWSFLLAVGPSYQTPSTNLGRLGVKCEKQNVELLYKNTEDSLVDLGG